MVYDELDICTCDGLVPEVGPWPNKGKNGGFSRGWVGLSALCEGIIQDVILGLNEVMGEIEILYHFGRQLCERHENLTPSPTHNLANDNTVHISRPRPA